MVEPACRVCALPPHMGIRLAEDQRLPGGNDSDKDNGNGNDGDSDANTPSLPEILRLDNVRHVAPYFVHRELPVGRLARGETLGTALGVLPEDYGRENESKSQSQTQSRTQSQNRSQTRNRKEHDSDKAHAATRVHPIRNTSIVTNKALRDWWPGELVAGRLLLLRKTKTKTKARDTNESGIESTIGTTTTTTTTAPIPATPETVAQNAGDVLIGRYHFHEQSIGFRNDDDDDDEKEEENDGTKPAIVHEDDRYVALNKPGGIDVLSNPDAHRVFQSLPGLALTGDLRRGPDSRSGSGSGPRSYALFPAHRIDHPVSGLVCCGLTPSDAKRLSRRIQARETAKTYLARVSVGGSGSGSLLAAELLGSLPRDVTVPLGFDRSTGTAVAVDRVGATASFDDANSDANANSNTNTNTNTDNSSLPLRCKEARTTVLEVLVPDLGDGTAVIAVRPHTGRKHQIRKHLQHAGIPIANDERYGGSRSGSGSGGGGSSRFTGRRSAYGLPDPSPELVRFFADRTAPGCRHCSYLQSLFHNDNNDNNNDNDTSLGPLLSQPIWLHSWRYEFPSLELSFEAPPPAWACPERWSSERTEP